MKPDIKQSLFVVLLVFVMSACTRDEPPSEVVYTKIFNPYHVVEEGESVESIAKKYQMSEQDLIAINSLQAPYTLIPGQRILVHRRADELPQNEDVSTQQLEEPEKNQSEEGFVEVDPEEDALAATKDNLQWNTQEVGETAQKMSPQTGTVYVWPVKGRILQKFGLQNGGEISNGITIAAPEGTPVVAIKSGEVKYANSTVEGYGKMVIIRHPDGMMSTYAHLKDFAAGVSPGKSIAGGAKIGRVGKTGCKRPQLQLQIRDKDRKPVDPLTLLN